MKFKALLFTYLILVMPVHCKADFKNNLKNHLAISQSLIQQNIGQVAKIAAGSLSMVTGSFIILHGASTIYKGPKDLDQRDLGAFIVVSSALSAMYCGYHTLNNACENKLNNAVKGLLQKAKAQLSRPQTNEQK